MKFCAYCKHFMHAKNDEKASFSKCAAGPKEVSLVTGEFRFAYCSDMRASQSCGKDALLFEAREEAA